jgi:hypothetical protein
MRRTGGGRRQYRAARLHTDPYAWERGRRAGRAGRALAARPPAALRAINEGHVYQFSTKPCNEVNAAITIRRALEHKDSLAKSCERLEVTKRQSTLIEGARMLRRLRDLPRADRATLIAKGEEPVDRRQLPFWTPITIRPAQSGCRAGCGGWTL